MSDYDSTDPDVRTALLAKLEAETRYETARAEREEESVKSVRLSFEDAERNSLNYTSADIYHHVFRLTGVIGSDSYGESTVDRAIKTLSYWRRNDVTPQPYELVLNTPGGSVFDGMELFDYMRELSAAGHHSITTIRGMAASMGAILSQAGDTRRMGQNSFMLIHRPSTMAYGEVGQLEDTVTLLQHVCDRVVDVFIRRSRNAEAPLSEDEFRAKWERKDWTLTAAEAKRHGFIDVIV